MCWSHQSREQEKQRTRRSKPQSAWGLSRSTWMPASARLVACSSLLKLAYRQDGFALLQLLLFYNIWHYSLTPSDFLETLTGRNQHLHWWKSQGLRIHGSCNHSPRHILALISFAKPHRHQSHCRFHEKCWHRCRDRLVGPVLLWRGGSAGLV